MKLKDMKNIELIKIENVIKTNQKVSMIDLEVQGNHNFVLADGVITHNCIGMLKSALWDIAGIRKIIYKSTQNRINIPEQFEFRGKVAIATNTYNADNPDIKAVLSRCFGYAFEFDSATMKQILYEFAKLPIFDMPIEQKYEVIDTLENFEAIRNINFRTLLKLFLIRKQSQNWQDLIKSQLEIDDDIVVLLNILKQSLTTKDAEKQFVTETNLSRRQFYYMKKRYFNQNAIEQGAKVHNVTHMR